jgi:hypothetical protein
MSIEEEEVEFIRLRGGGREEFAATERRTFRKVWSWFFGMRRVEVGPPRMVMLGGEVLEPTGTRGEYFHPTLKLVFRRVAEKA